MGDLPLREALHAWPDKSIWVGFPSAVFDMGPEATADFATQLLSEAGDGDRIVIEMSTENLVSNDNLLALTGVLEQGRLPLAPS
jgi:hypothetical protein